MTVLTGAVLVVVLLLLTSPGQRRGQEVAPNEEENEEEVDVVADEQQDEAPVWVQEGDAFHHSSYEEKLVDVFSNYLQSPNLCDQSRLVFDRAAAEIDCVTGYDASWCKWKAVWPSRIVCRQDEELLEWHCDGDKAWIYADGIGLDCGSLNHLDAFCPEKEHCVALFDLTVSINTVILNVMFAMILILMTLCCMVVATSDFVNETNMREVIRLTNEASRKLRTNAKQRTGSKKSR